MPTTILAVDNQEDPIVNDRLKSLTIDWNTAKTSKDAKRNTAN